MWGRTVSVKVWTAMTIGLLAGAALSIPLIHPKVAAQAQQPVVQNQRYQMSTWAYPSGSAGGGGSMSSFGAYIFDSQTGRLWLVREQNKPEPVGIIR